eukprot:TRINITY_DN492_c0_g2_i1.p1 TRINITY_DN492_c0_g2~~TRINITY_DN492_c0_g2_i1.p1  ORF type:complete len:440 (-),score=77.69 TRINITY_DN492_c0_g2_i1:326-1645(-)
MHWFTVFAPILSLFVSVTCQPDTCFSEDFGVSFGGAPTFSVSRINATCTCTGGYITSGISVFSGGIGTANGSTNVHSNLLAKQDLTVTGAFTANGPSVFNSNVALTSGTLTSASGFSASFSGPLTSSGTSAFSGPVTFLNSVTVTGGQTVNIATTGSAGVLNVGSATTATPINVWGSASLKAAADVSGALTVSGIATFNAGLRTSRSAGSVSSPDVSVAAGSQTLQFFSNIASGVAGLAAAGDSALLFSAGSSGTGNLTIGPAGPGVAGLRMTSNGNVGINTNTPMARLHVNGEIRGESSLSTLGMRVQRDIFQWSSGVDDSTCLSVHLKTSLLMSRDVSMFRFLIEGYTYRAAAVINTECCGYVYASDFPNALYNTQCVNRGGGVSGSSLYKSSDNYLVIQINLVNTYFAGFSVSVWQVNPTTPVVITMTAYSQCTSL